MVVNIVNLLIMKLFVLPCRLVNVVQSNRQLRPPLKIDPHLLNINIVSQNMLLLSKVSIWVKENIHCQVKGSVSGVFMWCIFILTY